MDLSERNSCAHGGEVVGVACDSTNTLMISAGYHGDIKVHILYLKTSFYMFFMHQVHETSIFIICPSTF